MAVSVEIRDLSITFGSGHTALKVLPSVSFKVEPGECFGLVEFVEHRAGLCGLLSLPPVPARPARISQQGGNQQPGDEVAVLIPPGFETGQLFLLFEIVCHDG